ncbi:hypothetical protein JX266_006076 [Neoarthrinium moseri]|nr:hypothetical protein JX266_006076 [Neoarthrinium moseri]
MVTDSGAGASSSLETRRSTVTAADVAAAKEHDTLFAFGRTMDSSISTIENEYASDNASNSHPPDFDDDDDNTGYSSSTSSTSDIFDHHRNGVGFVPLPTASAAHPKVRPYRFMAKLARIRQRNVPSLATMDAARPVSVADNLPRLMPSSLSSSTSGSGEDTNTSEEGLVAGMTDHWTRMRKQRVHVHNILDEIRPRRVQLQEIRRQKNEADSAIFQDLRRGLFRDDPAAMEMRLQRIDRLQLSTQNAEQTLEALMEDLEVAERELEVLERRFYSQFTLDDSPASTSERVSPALSRRPSRTSLFGISQERAELSHPLYVEMREAFKSLQLARDRIHNLNFRRMAIEAENVRYSRSEQEFLNNFAEYEMMARDRLDHWTKEFDRLQALCREKHVVPINTPFVEDNNGYQPILRHEDDRTLQLQPTERASPSTRPKNLAHPRYPILLSNPKHLVQHPFPYTARGALKMAVSTRKDLPNRDRIISEATQEYGIHTLLFDAKPEDKNDFINRWLLHKLRTSAMEVLVLYSTFRTVLNFVDIDRWQRDILMHWSRDEAVKPAGASRQPSRSRNYMIGDDVSQGYYQRDTVSEPLELHHMGSWNNSGRQTPVSQAAHSRVNKHPQKLRILDLEDRQSWQQVS